MATSCGAIRVLLRTSKKTPYHIPEYQKIMLSPEEAHTAYANFLRAVRKLKKAKIESNWITKDGKTLSFSEFINYRNIELIDLGVH